MTIEVFKMDSQLVRVGVIQDSGTAISTSGVIQGRLRRDGTLLRGDGGFLGQIQGNGTISTSITELSRIRIDHVGNILDGNDIIGRLKIDWASPIPRERAVYAAWTLLAN
ncbi:MAG: hypothetical protein AAGD96_31255 [Chloroflexota bacterium]